MTLHELRVDSRHAAVSVFAKHGQKPGHYDVADAVSDVWEPALERLTRERDEALAAAHFGAATIRNVEALFDRHDAAGHNSVPTVELRTALDSQRDVEGGETP